MSMVQSSKIIRSLQLDNVRKIVAPKGTDFAEYLNFLSRYYIFALSAGKGGAENGKMRVITGLPGYADIEMKRTIVDDTWKAEVIGSYLFRFSSSAFNTFSAVKGGFVSLTPTASYMAFDTAGRAPFIPISETLLAP